MSTSTLGGFESEERKHLFDEYLFQRRVLFGLSLSIVFMVFIWTVAICSDHWIIVASEDGEQSSFYLLFRFFRWPLVARAPTTRATLEANCNGLFLHFYFSRKNRKYARVWRVIIRGPHASHAVTVRNSLSCAPFFIGWRTMPIGTYFVHILIDERIKQREICVRMALRHFGWWALRDTLPFAATGRGQSRKWSISHLANGHHKF